MLHTYRRRTTRRRGQALAEFALVVPIFLLLVGAIMDFGFLVFQRMSVINASREGARAAVMVADAGTAEIVAKQAATSAASRGGLSVSMGDVTVTCFAKGGGAIGCGSAKVGDSVRVTVGYSYHPFFPLLVGTSVDLSSSTQMVFDSVDSA